MFAVRGHRARVAMVVLLCMLVPLASGDRWYRTRLDVAGMFQIEASMGLAGDQQSRTEFAVQGMLREEAVTVWLMMHINDIFVRVAIALFAGADTVVIDASWLVGAPPDLIPYLWPVLRNLLDREFNPRGYKPLLLMADDVPPAYTGPVCGLVVVSQDDDQCPSVCVMNE
jgi:hypothetical protein